MGPWCLGRERALDGTVGSDRLIALTRADEPRKYFSFDGLRSVVNLTDDSGSAAASYHLDAWGNYRFPSELAASKNRFGFTGYIYDEETKLWFAKARFYDPETARFTTQDSYLGQPDDPPTLHRYFYANANPMRYVDPTGHAAGDWWDPRTYFGDGRRDAQQYWAGYGFGQGRNLNYGPGGALAYATPEVQQQTLDSFGTQFKEGMKGAEADKGAVIIVASVGAAVALGRTGGEVPARAPGASKPITRSAVESNARTANLSEAQKAGILKEPVAAAGPSAAEPAAPPAGPPVEKVAAPSAPTAAATIDGPPQTVGVEYPLKRPSGVTDAQWQAKMNALNKGAAEGRAKVVYAPERTGAAQKAAREQGAVQPGDDADHGLDLQFGGEDSVGEIVSTTPRVNRSVGGQGRARLQYPDGTPIVKFTEAPPAPQPASAPPPPPKLKVDPEER